jgi:hypothetical protein
MAATQVSKTDLDNQSSLAREVWHVTFDAGATATITPTTIESIENVYFTPLNAAATGAASVYATYTFGLGTVDVACPDTGILLVTVEGRTA